MIRLGWIEKGYWIKSKGFDFKFCTIIYPIYESSEQIGMRIL